MGVDMLLYLVKHSSPNLANMTRELSKVNNGANPAGFKELLHVIKEETTIAVNLIINGTVGYCVGFCPQKQHFTMKQLNKSLTFMTNTVKAQQNTKSFIRMLACVLQML